VQITEEHTESMLRDVARAHAAIHELRESFDPGLELLDLGIELLQLVLQLGHQLALELGEALVELGVDGGLNQRVGFT
jgi:hypothetical protein